MILSRGRYRLYMDIELPSRFSQMCSNWTNPNRGRKAKMTTNSTQLKTKITTRTSEVAKSDWSSVLSRNGNRFLTCGFLSWLVILALPICTMLLSLHRLILGGLFLINALKDSSILISFSTFSRALDMRILMSIFRILKLLQRSICLDGWSSTLCPFFHFLRLSQC